MSALGQQWRIVEVTEGRGALCRIILESLPDWFGIQESIDEYVVVAENQTMFAAFDGPVALGFVSVYRHFAHSFEVHSMGILQQHHRRGIGRALLAQAETDATAKGGRFLTVKTLAESWDDPHYACTREFYLGVGFLEVEEFADLWGDFPCLFLIKTLPVAPEADGTAGGHSLKG